MRGNKSEWTRELDEAMVKIYHFNIKTNENMFTVQ